MIEPIIVVGPGRCGTSCVAGVLHHLGVFMGSRFVPADGSNPYGHWEDFDFFQLNDAFLNQAVPRLAWERGVRNLIERRDALQVPWGWKDPRTCDLLRDYLGFLGRPLFIRCVRDPAGIESSLVKAYGFSPADARELRVRRERELDQYLPPHNTMEVDFAQLRTNQRTIVESLARFCGLAEATAAQISAATSFIRGH